MGTLATELGRFASDASPAPRIYADANIPFGVVSFMRTRLKWDVLYVVEHEDLRRASDARHYQLARQLRRTLVTLDHDFVDDRRFPPDESGGVIICQAPDERALHRLMRRVDRALFRRGDDGATPLAGRKVRWHPHERVLRP
jgi:predicted nuclease of predicted toxin-antitoxin system